MGKRVRYKSVSDMLKDSTDDNKLVKDVEDRIAKRQMIKHLVAQRVKRELTQCDVASHIGCTQSWVSKIESSDDDDVRLGDIDAYADAIGLQVRLVIASKNQTMADEVKFLAARLKSCLQQLVDMAGDDKEMVYGVSKFVCVEVPATVLSMVVDTMSKLPAQTLKRLSGTTVENCSLIIDVEETEPDLEVGDRENHSEGEMLTS